MINKVELDSLDLSMDESILEPEETRDIPSNKKDVEPHDSVKEEIVISLDLYREASKEHGTTWFSEKIISYFPRLGPERKLGKPGRRGGDSNMIKTSISRKARIGGSDNEFEKKWNLDYINKEEKAFFNNMVNGDKKLNS